MAASKGQCRLASRRIAHVAILDQDVEEPFPILPLAIAHPADAVTKSRRVSIVKNGQRILTMTPTVYQPFCGEPFKANAI